MQFDEFDNKIRDAAEHHHPSYDEKAWERMETLLDKHLPQKKDKRRRILFFLLLLLIFGSGAFLILRNGSGPVLPASTSESRTAGLRPDSVAGKIAIETPGKKSENSTNDDPVSGAPIPLQNADTKKTGTDPVTEASADTKNKTKKGIPAAGLPYSDAPIARSNSAILTNSTGSHKPVDAKANKNSSLPVSKKKILLKQTHSGVIADNSSTITRETAAHPSGGKTKKSTLNQPSVPTGGLNEKSSILADTTIAIGPSLSVPEQKSSAEATTVAAQEIKPASDSIAQGANTASVEKNRDSVLLSKKATSNLQPKKKVFVALTLTAGPDLSFVGLGEFGKVKMKYGAGLGFGYHRFTLRSGFYITDKVYAANGSYYHPYYADLEKVDGDCRIFEIPLTVSYNFLERKKYNLFASTGLSSYLMKKETYGYHVKGPSGYPRYWADTLDNKNKHYFAVLNLSAGYEQKFNNNFSLIVEPYLQLPLTGVGKGKMKLNSTGILVTLAIKPFGRKK